MHSVKFTGKTFGTKLETLLWIKDSLFLLKAGVSAEGRGSFFVIACHSFS